MKMILTNRLISKLQLAFALMLFTSVTWAQTFTATVNKNPIGLNEQFQLSFTLNSSGNNFRGPSLSDFMVLSGPNQSTSMQFINGSMSQSVSYSYILQPKKEGTFKLEPATVEAGGKVVLSNMVTITVTKGSGQSSQKGSRRMKKQTFPPTTYLSV
ncbi:MAG TPA: BatD family protein [Bacteroidia bacterium]|nr:BatD family protein [Bacteroidia bacterium]